MTSRPKFKTDIELLRMRKVQFKLRMLEKIINRIPEFLGERNELMSELEQIIELVSLGDIKNAE